MNEAQSNAQFEEAIGEVMTKGLSGLAPIEHRPDAASPRPVDRGAVAPKAGGGGSNWGPSSPRITSPTQMLAQVADHAVKLHDDLIALTTAITGEAPHGRRLRQHPTPNGGLLPAIANIAHEIEQQQCEMAQLIRHVRGQL